MGIALDPVEERRCQARPDLDLARPQVLGENRRRGAVIRADIPDQRVVAGAFGVVIDHGIDFEQTLGRLLAENVGLHVDEDEAVHFIEFIGGDHPDLDAQGLDQCAVFGARHFAEGDQGGRWSACARGWP